MTPLLLLPLLLEWGMPAADRKSATDWNQMTDKDWEKAAAQWEEGDQLAELTTDDQALFNEMEMRQRSTELGTPPAEYSMRSKHKELPSLRKILSKKLTPQMYQPNGDQSDKSGYISGGLVLSPQQLGAAVPDESLRRGLPLEPTAAWWMHWAT